jgi:hypothetical protein
MSSVVHGFPKAAGSFLVVAAGALAGCVVTGGASGPLVNGPASAGYAVCSGGHASRLPEREQVGRTCRPATSLQALY